MFSTGFFNRLLKVMIVQYRVNHTNPIFNDPQGKYPFQKLVGTEENVGCTSILSFFHKVFPQLPQTITKTDPTSYLISALDFNPFPHNDTFWRPWETSLLKTLWEKEKLLITSNFPFSHNDFKRLVLQTRKNKGLFAKELKDFKLQIA